jgi:hypothetical protein
MEQMIRACGVTIVVRRWSLVVCQPNPEAPRLPANDQRLTTNDAPHAEAF